MSENKKKIEDIKEKIKDLENDRINLGMQLQVAKIENNRILQCIEALKIQKRVFFSLRKSKKEYREKNKMYSEQLQSSITNESLINGKLIEVERQIQCFQVEIEKIISKSKD